MQRMDALPKIVTDHLGEVRALCQKYSVRKLTIFGSAVKGTFDPEKSDLDFLVEFLPHTDAIVQGRKYLELWEALETLFGRTVDLVSFAEIKNPYVAASIRRDQVFLYAAA
jgi:uncharacterized protein